MSRLPFRRTRAHDGAGSFFEEWARRNAGTGPDRASIAMQPPRRVLAVGAVVGVAAAGLLLTGSHASADPSAHTWYRLRMCESSNNYGTDTGNGHYGAYQFDVPTWRSVGGSGLPSRASKAEQDARALILYRERGWQPWQCAGILGLRPDADAGSGRISDIRVPSGRRAAARHHHAGPHHHAARHHHAVHRNHQRSSARGIPPFPGGSHWYYYGETSPKIKIFQDEMHRRGYFPVGTGEYGPHTLEVVKQLQRLNGLVPNGYIGPNTWRLAWSGRYSEPGTGSAPKIPPFPGGSHWYYYGETSPKIKIFQDEMHRRGSFPVGTGEYGPHTLEVVKQLQRLNGLVPNGYIGPNTWRLAWIGRYHNP